MICTARGTAQFWIDMCGVRNFAGPGTYEVDGFILEISRDGRVDPEKKAKEKAIGQMNKIHESVEKYGYGHMFFGIYKRQ